MGKLYLVPTPIGNLKDITLRALEVLKEADMVAAEDTRVTLKLLNKFDIKKSLISYHQHNEQGKSENIIDKLKEGATIALVSDAGMPGISDPGAVIVSKCIDEGIPFEVLPGASAVPVAVVSAGFDTTSFTFAGFLPKDRKGRREHIAKYKDREETIVFYEAPHRMIQSLSALHEGLGDRTIAICRELTKLHEEVLRMPLTEAIKHFEENKARGEFVLVVEGKSSEELVEEQRAQWDEMSIKDHIIKYIEEGLSKKDAIKKVAKDRGLPKAEVYSHSIDI